MTIAVLLILKIAAPIVLKPERESETSESIVL
jgi:hypothetical protein